MWALIRAFFLKGGTLEEGIKAFTKANKGITKSDGQKLINIYQDVQKNTATVTDLQKFKDKKGIKSIPVNEQFTRTQAQDFKTFGKEVIDELNAPIKPDLEVVKNKFFDPSGKMKTEGKNIVKEGLAGLEKKTLLRDSQEAIAKIKAENKAAIERLKKKKTVEDFSDDGDFDPGGMASGGLANILGV